MLKPGQIYGLIDPMAREWSTTVSRVCDTVSRVFQKVCRVFGKTDRKQP